MVARSHNERALIARVAAHKRWANEPDRTAATAAARQAANDRFAKQVDPDGVLPPDERAKRAKSAEKAHMLQMSLKSAQARQSRAGGRK